MPSFFEGPGGRIRTSVGKSQQIYSLPQLATLVPLVVLVNYIKLSVIKLTMLKRFIATWLPSADLRRLVIARGLRSVAQGYIMVVFAIYLSQIGFSPWLIGLTIGIGSIVSAILTLMSGILSDRIGRKPFLIAYGILLAFSGFIFGITTVPVILIVTSAFGGIGRSGGAGGQAGPFAPAETAILSEKTTVATRPKVFAVNNVVGTAATAIGSILAGLPELISQVFHISIFRSYQPLFLAIGVIGIITFIILLPITEAGRPETKKIDPPEQKKRNNFDRIWKFSVAGLINGFGLGFIGGILPYWLYLRFGVSPAAIGPVIGIGSLLTAFFSLGAVPLSRRFGDINVISGSRVAAAVFTFSLAFAPTYPIAALLVILRMSSAMSAMPIRQSYTMGIIDADVRGTAAGIGGVSRRLPAAVSPVITGYWLNMSELELPFFASALFMGANAVLYFFWFHKIKPEDTI